MPPEAWLLSIIGGLISVVIGQFTWLMRALGTGKLRTDREFQDASREKEWLRSSLDAVTKDYRELSAEHAATTAHVLTDLRDAVSVKKKRESQ
jgi:uncharacterized membrane-anchored protein YhcB (DUF1043 family)